MKLKLISQTLLYGLLSSIIVPANAYTLFFSDTVSLTDGAQSTLTFDEFQVGLTDGSNTVQVGETLQGVNVTVRVIQTGGSASADNDGGSSINVTGRWDAYLSSFTSNHSLESEDAFVFDTIGGGTFLTTVMNASALVTEELTANNGDSVGSLDTESGTSASLGSNVTGYVTNDYFTGIHGTSDASDGGAIVSSDVSSFVGTGDVTYSATPFFQTGVTFGGGDVEQQASSGAMTFEVDLEYIVIPETSTLAMFGIVLGSAGLVAFFRRRTRA